ncbi:hypothetical protein AAG906_007765 [Vitis piasezkii]
MSERESEHVQLPLLLIFLGLLPVCSGDIGTAGQYAPPYLPTACYGNDVSKFPSSNLFASAGDGIWDNGAACGRQYFVRCLSAQAAGICKSGQIIVNIVDRASRNGVMLVLSTIAFGAIANPSAAWVNIEFAE